MSAIIDYYFTSVSPFTWLGHDALMEIAARHAKQVEFRPFNLAGVWEVSGAVPPAQRPATRQRYRIIELQRIAEYRGLKLNPKPSNFPTNPELADRCVIAIANAGENPATFLFAVGEALWSHDRQVADKSVLFDLLERTGHDANAVLTAANTDNVAAIRAANTKAAIDADAVGAPAYVYKGEVFWGQDRLDHLDHMIRTGRDAFAP